MKIKIVSDGTAPGTRIVNVETGETLEGVVGVTWDIQLLAPSIAVIKVQNVPAELVADKVWTVEEDRHPDEDPEDDYLWEQMHGADLDNAP